MAATRTRLELANDARALADQDVQGGVQRVSDTQVNIWINQELAALQDLIASVDPHRFLAETAINAVTNTYLYTLPADFYQLLMVERDEGDEAITLEPFTLNQKNERNRTLDGLSHFGAAATRYMLRGNSLDGTGVRLWLWPDPGTHVYTVYYVTAPVAINTAAGGDAQAIDGASGWLEWVVYGVAIRMKERDEEDSSTLRADRAQIERQVELGASRRDAGRPVLPTDVRRRIYDYPRAR